MATHYETLGVSENATQDDIKKAYRSLASKNHPDKGGDTAKFQEIQAAYAAIETTEKREQYDRERKGMGQAFRFEDFGGDRGFPPGMEDIFSRFGFGPQNPFHQHARPQPRRNRDTRINITVPLEAALEEQTKIISFRTTNGTEQEVEVKIPRGVRNGDVIKYANLGDNLFGSLPRGDLLVEFVIPDHQKFQINGIDLYTTIDINAIDAIIGCSLEFESLDNRTFSLTVPKGTQPGTKFKIGGQGLYALNQPVRGNLYLIANITIPTDLTESQLETLRQLTK